MWCNPVDGPNQTTASQARQAVCVIVTHDLHFKSCLTAKQLKIEGKHMAQYIRSPCTRARSLAYQQQQHSTSYTLVTHFTMLFVTSAFFEDTDFSMSLKDCSVSFSS